MKSARDCCAFDSQHYRLIKPHVVLVGKYISRTSSNQRLGVRSVVPVRIRVRC